METPASATVGVDPAYLHYWRRKQLLQQHPPQFPVCRWFPTAPDVMAESERIIYDAAKQASSVLEVGAGDLKFLRKFRAADYRGEYHTQDIGDEYSYDYATLDQVQRTYGAILCIDVLEHLPLGAGLGMVLRMVDLLAPGGVLIVQTPNARCVRHPSSWDMTHVHCYNPQDLWAYLSCLDLQVEGYRVAFTPGPKTGLWRVGNLIRAYVATRLIGGDYADNLLMIARKPG